MDQFGQKNEPTPAKRESSQQHRLVPLPPYSYHTVPSFTNQLHIFSPRNILAPTSANSTQNQSCQSQTTPLIKPSPYTHPFNPYTPIAVPYTHLFIVFDPSIHYHITLTSYCHNRSLHLLLSPFTNPIQPSVTQSTAQPPNLLSAQPVLLFGPTVDLLSIVFGPLVLHIPFDLTHILLYFTPHHCLSTSPSPHISSP